MCSITVFDHFTERLWLYENYVHFLEKPEDIVLLFKCKYPGYSHKITQNGSTYPNMTCLDCMLLGIKSPLGLGFFLHSSTFQLHVSDSLYSKALAFSQVPSGIAFTDMTHMYNLPTLMVQIGSV